MPTLVPDRVPTFDPASQRWHWWSTPGQPSSFQQDQERAETIEVVWETYDRDEGRSWVAVVPTLPGFAPFLWNISHNTMWLRRPEGVWKFPVPSGVRRKDHVLVQEVCEGLSRLDNRRRPIQCIPSASINDWHMDASALPLSLEAYDREVLGQGVVPIVNGEPVLVNRRLQRVLPDIPPYSPIVIELWSRPGPMKIMRSRIEEAGMQQKALIITLPNGVKVAHLYKNGTAMTWAYQKPVAIVSGDDDWTPMVVQPVIIDVDGSGDQEPSAQKE